MAVFYVRSADGDDADSGATWALAKATIAGALSAASAGDTIYVADGHAETGTTAKTMTSPGTMAQPVKVVCVDDTGDPEPPTARATTATVTTTGTGGNGNITLAGIAYYYGVSFSGTNWFVATGSGHAIVVEESTFTVRSNINQTFQLGSSNQSQRGFIRFKNVWFDQVPTANGRLTVFQRFIWEGGGYVTDAVVSGTFVFNAVQGHAPITVIGVDFSVIGSGYSLVNLAAVSGQITLIECKLGASVAVASGTPVLVENPIVTLVNCDSADTNYRFHREDYRAAETQETTLVRTGGATDGTTPVSRKVVTTANVTPFFPYESQWLEFWNETVGSSVSVSIPILTDNVTLTDAEAWVEVEYLGTSGFPLALFTSDRVSDPIFGTPANQPTDGSSSWTTTGLGTPVKQTLSVSFTPQEKGIIRARVCVAKASTTVYYDPLILASSGRQYQGVAGYLNEGVSSGGGIGGRVIGGGF